DRNRCGRLLCREGGGCAEAADDVNLEFRERACEPWQPRSVTVCPSSFDSDVPPLDVTQLRQALSERLQLGRAIRGRRGREPPDPPDSSRLGFLRHGQEGRRKNCGKDNKGNRSSLHGSPCRWIPRWAGLFTGRPSPRPYSRSLTSNSPEQGSAPGAA